MLSSEISAQRLLAGRMVKPEVITFVPRMSHFTETDP